MALTGLRRCPPTIRLTTDRFGTAMAPLVFGWMFVGHQIGASIAAYGAGLTRTLDGTYAPAFALSGILCIVAGFASLGIDGNRKKDDAKTVLPRAQPCVDGGLGVKLNRVARAAARCSRKQAQLAVRSSSSPAMS